MNISERIRALRIEHALTQKQLSEKIGVSVTTIAYWENEVKTPSISAVTALCRVFKVSADYLLGVTDFKNDHPIPMSRQEKRLVSDFRLLDKYGKDAVTAICKIERARIEDESSRPTDTVYEISKQNSSPNRYIPHYLNPSAAGFSSSLDGDDFEMILADDTVPKDADMAVSISGNSMQPYINDGDVVFVKRNCELENGDIGIFSVDGTMFCKHYYSDQNRNLFLVSANPELRNSNIYLDADSGSVVVCFGKVLVDGKVTLPKYFLDEISTPRF